MANASPTPSRKHFNPFRALTITSVVIILCCFQFSSSQARLTTAESRQLDHFILEVMRCADIPALSVSLVGPDGVAYEQGYDDTNKNLPTPRQRTSKDTVFCLGGSTQAFTSVLLSTLMSYKENITFDTPVHEITGSHYHLPGRFRTQMINLKDILGMRTGLSNMDIMATAMSMNRIRMMQNLRFAPEVSQFREDNVYSEVLYSLTEDVARAMGGKTWYELMRQYIFNRLGMDHASFVHTDARDNSHVAPPVEAYSNQFTQIPWEAYMGQEMVAAATSVCASASDMSKWIHFILSGGKTLNNEQIVNENTITDTFKSVQSRSNGGNPRITGFKQPTIQMSYTRESNALGWIKGMYRGYAFVSQDGSLPGYESLTTIIPQRSVGVFTAFTGAAGSKAFAAKVLINLFAIDLLLHGTGWVDRNSVCEVLNKMVTMADASDPSMQSRTGYLGRANEPIRPMEEYEGTYRNYGFGDLTVRRNETGPLKLEYGKLGKYVLHPTQQNDTFIMQAAQGPLWYTTHADEYRKKGPFLAIFSNRHDDPSRRIETVTIPHFASDMDPEFSKNPIPPRRLDDDYDHRCDACASIAASVSLVLASCLMGVFGLVR